MSISSSGIVWTGPTISSDYFSVARGHCLTNLSGSPITTKIASISEVSFINICCLECPRSSASSTFMWTGRFFSTSLAVNTPLLILHANAGNIGVLGSSLAHPIMSKISCASGQGQGGLGILLIIIQWHVKKAPSLMPRQLCQRPCLWLDYISLYVAHG